MADIQTVMATGTFDLLHMGHIFFLNEAKKLGQKLVVVVARDNTVRRLKHEPINPENTRLGIIKELKMVDEAYLGSKNDMYSIVEKIQPNTIALGYDQIHDKTLLSQELQKRGFTNIKIIRLDKYDGGSDLEGTRRIIQKIINAYSFQKKIERLEES